MRAPLCSKLGMSLSFHTREQDGEQVSLNPSPGHLASTSPVFGSGAGVASRASQSSAGKSVSRDGMLIDLARGIKGLGPRVSTRSCRRRQLQLRSCRIRTPTLLRHAYDFTGCNPDERREGLIRELTAPYSLAAVVAAGGRRLPLQSAAVPI